MYQTWFICLERKGRGGTYYVVKVQDDESKMIDQLPGAKGVTPHSPHLVCWYLLRRGRYLGREGSSMLSRSKYMWVGGAMAIPICTPQ